MPLFDGVPTYPRTRNLSVSVCHGQVAAEDVYALQRALQDLGFDAGVSDGLFGQQTDSALRAAQGRYLLGIDGVAGGVTQAKLTSMLCLRERGVFSLPAGLAYGQTGHESGHRLGIYSWIVRPDGSFDAGVAQLNSRIYDLELAFDPLEAIHTLGASTRKHFDLFEGVLTARRWRLAAGAWNAPAYACAIANEEGARVPKDLCATPSPGARRTLEAYMASACALMVLR